MICIYIIGSSNTANKTSSLQYLYDLLKEDFESLRRENENLKASIATLNSL